jgi:cytochrome c oxidase cbb3-type subunit 1
MSAAPDPTAADVPSPPPGSAAVSTTPSGASMPPAGTVGLSGGPLVDRRLVAHAFGWFLVWLIVAPMHGLVVAQKLNREFMELYAWETWGRLRPFHVNGVIFGVFTNGVWAAMYYLVPRLTGTPMFAARIGYLVVWLWNLALIVGALQLLTGLRVELITPERKALIESADPAFAAGYTGATADTVLVETSLPGLLGLDDLVVAGNTGLEAGELSLFAAVPLLACFIAATVQVLGTMARRTERDVYVSLWYLSAALLWTDLNFLLGLMLPYTVKPGITNAAVHGLYIHYVVGLWITPAGLAIIYYVLPSAARTPLYSHKLSLIGFWSLAFFYPFVGTHHYLYSPIVDWAETAAIVMGMMLIIPVWTVIQNFFGTMVGQWKRVHESPAVKFLMVGTVWYLIGCFQGSTQALRELQKPTHFTDFVISHSHLTVFGTFVIYAIAAGYYLWPRVTGRKLYSRKAATWHFWLTVCGFSLMAAGLAAQGMQQGWMLSPDGKLPGADWLSTVSAMKPWWDVRSVAGAVMVIGMIVYVWNMVQTARRGDPRPGGFADRPGDETE